MKDHKKIVLPPIVINPELSKLKELNLFQEKFERANAFLKAHGKPTFSNPK